MTTLSSRHLFTLSIDLHPTIELGATQQWRSLELPRIMCHPMEQRLGAGEQAELGQRTLADADQTRLLETLAVFGLLGGNARPE